MKDSKSRVEEALRNLVWPCSLPCFDEGFKDLYKLATNYLMTLWTQGYKNSNPKILNCIYLSVVLHLTYHNITIIHKNIWNWNIDDIDLSCHQILASTSAICCLVVLFLSYDYWRHLLISIMFSKAQIKWKRGSVFVVPNDDLISITKGHNNMIIML